MHFLKRSKILNAQSLLSQTNPHHPHRTCSIPRKHSKEHIDCDETATSCCRSCSFLTFSSSSDHHRESITFMNILWYLWKALTGKVGGMEWSIHPKFTRSAWRGCRTSKHFRKFLSSEHIWYGVGAAWVPSSTREVKWSCSVPYSRCSYASYSRKNRWDRAHLHEHARYSGVWGLHVLFQYNEGPVLTYILGIYRNRVSSEQLLEAWLLLLTAQERWALTIDWEYLHINQEWEHLHDCP